MPTEHAVHDNDQLNSYNVAQLQFALGTNPKCDPDAVPFLHELSSSPSPAVIPTDTALDYDARRMSSSATSTADTDSSVPSRGEKRSLTPADSPVSKRSRNDQNNWKIDSPSSRSTTGVNDKPSTDAGIDQSKVQLPSIFTTFEDSYKGDSRRASLPITHSESRVRHAPYPPTSLRQAYSPSNQSTLSSYTFPSNNEDAVEKHSSRPRLSTDLNFGLTNSYESAYPHSALSPYSETESWNSSPPSGIVRPSSTPGQLSSPPIKYDDSLRHSSFSAPTSQAQMYGSARISGQHDRRSKGDSWSFPSPDFVLPSNNPQYSPSMTPSAPSIAASNSPSRALQPTSSSQLVDRPQRKRGKLPKETTDYLKAWLHRHSDHPYPSEDEKKQLCHATGLSMSQVSNWMINARRRILAPAHRAASGPTTTAPFPPSSRSASLSGLLDPISRRSSMPTDTLQLYHPMTLQSMPSSHHSSLDYGSRHGRSSHHLSGGMEYSSNRHLGVYTSGPHTSGPGQPHYIPPDVPLSAPPSLSNIPFSSHHSQTSSQQNIYPSLQPSPRLSSSSHQSQQYYNEDQPHTGSAPGSGYATPQ